MAGFEQRLKKRNAAKMIDMAVREKNIEIDASPTFNQGFAEGPYPGPCVKQQAVIPDQNFDTGRVPALALMPMTRTGNRAPYAMKNDAVHGTNL